MQPIPITTTITPLTGNTTISPTPSFTFTAVNNFNPLAPAAQPVDALYFQFDTFQGPWTAATPNATSPGYSGTAPTLSAGTHILYAYATDGQDASSTHTGGNGIGEDSPLIGTIASYVFTVITTPTGPTVLLTPSSINFGNQAVGSASGAQTVVVKNTGTADLVFTSVGPAGGANPGDFDTQNTCNAQGTIPSGQTCTIAVAFIPTATGMRTANIPLIDNAADSPQSVTLSGTGTLAPANITATGGTPQSATVGTAFAAPFVVSVNDVTGAPVVGAVVTFTAPATGASGTFAGGVNTATTNANGLATSAVFTANATAGSYTVSGSVAGLTATANFALTNSAAAPASNIAASSGTPQSATVGAAFGAPLVAFVSNAAGGPVSGATVTFTAPATGASGTFAGGVNTATTNANGLATSAVFTANATAGNYTVTAAVAGVTAPANFALTNNAAPAANITATSGTPQSATISGPFAAPFVATVTNAAGAPVSGATVSFNTPDSGSGSPNGSFPGGAISFTATTNANGVATSGVFTANNIAGSYNVTARVQATNLSANFALTNNNPTPILTSISPTTGIVGQPVTLTLAGSNFVPGIIVNFGGNADTGGVLGDGILTITIPASQLSEAGPVTVTLSNPAPTAGPSAPQTFTITNSNSSNLVIAINGPITVSANTLTFNFNVQSVNGLAGVLTTTCSSAAVGCLVSPCPAPLIANRSVMLTGTLFPSSGGTLVGFKPSLPNLRLPLGWRLSLAYLACLLLLGLLSARKQSVRWGMAAVALTFALLAGCGGGGSTAPQGSVAAGQYTVNITATLGNATQTVQVTVKVQ